MSPRLKTWFPVPLVVLALGAGYSLPRGEPARGGGGDMLDAVQAVQRRSPRFLLSERFPVRDWARAGSLYLSRTPRTPDDIDALSRDPARYDPNWAGIVCFRGTDDPALVIIPWVADGGDRCVEYPTFAVYGDPELLAEVRAILADAGFWPNG